MYLGLSPKHELFWEIWYAWYPVTAENECGDLVTVWMEWVWRKHSPFPLGFSGALFRTLTNPPS